MHAFTRRAAYRRALVAAFAAFAEDAATNTLALTTKYGKTIIRLRPDLAPKHVAQIKKLVKRKFYDGIVFHRVIPGFMAQTGDPTGTGTGGSDLPDIAARILRRAISTAARSAWRARSDPDSANSQFFICFGDAGFLDGKYTVFGEVVSGMEASTRSRPAPQANNGTVDHPDKIISLRFAPDAK